MFHLETCQQAILYNYNLPIRFIVHLMNVIYLLGLVYILNGGPELNVQQSAGLVMQNACPSIGPVYTVAVVYGKKTCAGVIVFP